MEGTEDKAQGWDDAELDAARRAAYERYTGSPSGMSDLDLRAAAQWAQRQGDAITERAIDSELASRGQR